MQNIDITVALLYLVAVIAIGLISAKKSSNDSQLYLGGKEISWIPLGISVMISAFSAVNFIAFPTEIVKHGPAVLISLPVFLLVLIPIVRMIPFFRKQSGNSAYGFLESKFSPSVKHLATTLFMIWRLLWIAVTLYASAKMLAIMSGISLPTILLITGITAIFYSTIGGFLAVVYTDLLQFLVLFGTIITALFLAVQNGAVSVSTLSNWFDFHPFPTNFFSPNPTIRISFWSGLIGTFVAFFARYGADQITIQRYMAAKSDSEAKRAIFLNAGAALFVLTLLLFWGITISLVSESTGKPGIPPIKQMALFIGSMPAGITGLFVAAMLAATMSSIDSGLNAMAAALSEEFPVLHGSLRGKLTTLLLGISAMSLALLLIPIMTKEGSLFVVTNKIIHGFGAPILSLILLGIYSKQVTSRGVFWGTIIGAICSVVSVILLKDLAIHYYSVVNLGCSIGAAYLISCIDRLNLTTK